MRLKSMILMLWVLVAMPTELAFAQTQTFNFVGQPQTWVVPNSVTSITVDARGSQGGGSGADPIVVGGKGGRVQTTLVVTPGETLVIYVGAQGGNFTQPNTAGSGGFNGGSNGGIDNVDFNGPASGGGGASDVRRGGSDLAHRVIIAGGGGGAECCEDANGGAGGGTTGVSGSSPTEGGSSAGGGGTQSGGGAGGFGCNGNGGSGSLGQGGVGGNGNRAGGGGGGGYYGGGGGGGCTWGSGGGGGSSYSAGINTTHTQGYQTGDGQVTITWFLETTGTIQVTTNLSSATFSITGPASFSSSGLAGTFPNAPPGRYSIIYGPVTGYVTPTNTAETLSAAGTISFAGVYTKPHVIVVPGFGASTLTDSNQSDRWLSCNAILALSSGPLSNPAAFQALQYDANGNPLELQLNPTSILTQKDQISDTVKSNDQSIVQCDNGTLIDVAIDSNWFGLGLNATCFLASDYRKCLEGLMVGPMGADGTLLQFNSLLSNLAAAGYDTVPWYYDFRRDVRDLAADLEEEVVQLSSDGRPVEVVTHSMGSIVTAALIKYYPEVYNSGKLQYVVSMGAPFQGGLTDYLYLQGWSSFASFLNPQSTQLLGENWTSPYDLLPQWNFLVPYQQATPTNIQVFSGASNIPNFLPVPRLNALPAAEGLWSDLASIGPLDRWYAIIGSGFPTDALISQFLAAPADVCSEVILENGDGTVPLRSSEGGYIVHSWNQFYANKRHAELPGDTNVINGVLQILQGASPLNATCPGGSCLQAQPYSTTLSVSPLEFKTCSPIDLIATNSAGLTVGNNGNQIIGAEYTKPAGAAQIDVPGGDNYTLQAKGTGLGSFELVIRLLDANLQPTQTQIIPGIAAPGSLATYQVLSAGGISLVSLIATFQGSLADIANALGLGLIDNNGIATSLSQKLEAAQGASGPARNNILNAFINEVNAQAEKHITGAAPKCS